MKILIVEDDEGVAQMVRKGLTANNHVVEVASDGAEGSFLARSYEYDVITLDYTMPKKDGLMVCKEIRAAGKNTPILFLSVSGDTDLKIKALDIGADDYLTKPFSFEELYARLRAMVRRPTQMVQPKMKIKDLSIDMQSQTVRRGEKQIYLTRKEFGLLEYLMRNSGVVLSRALLMEHVWTADSDPLSNTVEAHIRNLRKKINIGNRPDLIHNIPGRGYKIEV